MTFIAGPYTATYNGQTIGIVQDGFELEIATEVEKITGDNLGSSVQDGVYLGGNAYISCVLEEFDATGVLAAFWPYAASFGLMGQVGTLLTAYDAALVLTKISGTNASPTSLTAAQAILAPNYPLRMLFGSRLRRVPIQFQLLPYVSTGTRWFSTT